MGAARTLTGRVIGYTVKYQPQEITDRGKFVITKKAKVGATVVVQEGKPFFLEKTHLVPCREVEIDLEDGQIITPALYTEVYNHLVTKHPFLAEREVNEGKKKNGHWYEFADEAKMRLR